MPGHLGLCLPPGGDLAIDLGGVLSSNNFAAEGLFRDGNTWRTTNPAFNANDPDHPAGHRQRGHH